MIRWLAVTALAALAALTLVTWRAYDGAAMQFAWESLLAFCGH